MSIVHMSYVICDVCGAPATQPKVDTKTARASLPIGWRRVIDPQTRWGRDICPIHTKEKRP